MNISMADSGVPEVTSRAVDKQKPEERAEGSDVFERLIRDGGSRDTGRDQTRESAVGTDTQERRIRDSGIYNIDWDRTKEGAVGTNGLEPVNRENESSNTDQNGPVAQADNNDSYVDESVTAIMLSERQAENEMAVGSRFDPSAENAGLSADESVVPDNDRYSLSSAVAFSGSGNQPQTVSADDMVERSSAAPSLPIHQHVQIAPSQLAPVEPAVDESQVVVRSWDFHIDSKIESVMDQADVQDGDTHQSYLDPSKWRWEEFVGSEDLGMLQPDEIGIGVDIGQDGGEADDSAFAYRQFVPPPPTSSELQAAPGTGQLLRYEMYNALEEMMGRVMGMPMRHVERELRRSQLNLRVHSGRYGDVNFRFEEDGNILKLIVNDNPEVEQLLRDHIASLKAQIHELGYAGFELA